MAAKPVIKVNSNPKPLNESQRLENNFNSWAKSQPSAQKNTVKETIKVNSNPNPTPAKANKTASYNARVGQGEYAENVINPNGGTPVVEVRSSGSLSQSGRLGGAHAGGHGISELEMAQGKTPSKLGGLGALGARIARATEGEVPLP